jgi:hypothetical protein
MKTLNIIFISIILFIVNCTPKMATQQAMPMNQEVKDNNGNIILLGKSTREQLAQPPFDAWFTKNYNAYIVDSNTAGQLKPLLKNKRFLIFMGTWCGDSRREVPRMYKIFDYCGVKASQIELVTMNNNDTAYKQSPGHEEKGLNIHRVPDLLIFDHDREQGRIVEAPVASLEKDLLAIVSEQAYEPRYKAVSRLIQLLQQSSLSSIQNRLPQIADTIKPFVSGPGELFSYAHVLLSAHENDKAVLVYELNSLLFPSDTTTAAKLQRLKQQ